MTTRIRLRTKHGRTFYRFGKQLHPEDWTEFDVTDAQLRSLQTDCRHIDAGGLLDMQVRVSGQWRSVSNKPDADRDAAEDVPHITVPVDQLAALHDRVAELEGQLAGAEAQLAAAAGLRDRAEQLEQQLAALMKPPAPPAAPAADKATTAPKGKS